MHKLIQQFLKYLKAERRRSVKTVKNYEFYLSRFLEFSKINSPDQINIELIRQYRIWLKRRTNQFGRPLKKSTQNYHLIALRSFLKYFSTKGKKILPAKKIELSVLPKRQIKFLDKDDMEKLLESPLKTNEAKIIQARDKAILELLFSSGLRVSEIVNLKKEQIDLKKDKFTIKGTAGKIRTIFLSNQTKYWLKQYIEIRIDKSFFLFVRADRAKGRQEPKNLTPRSIQRLIKKYSKTAEIKKTVTPHTMRHSFVIGLIKNGVNIHSIQNMLGHSSITTTQTYTDISDQQLKE